MIRTLITRPRHELVTYYLYHWSEVLIEEAKKKGSIYQLDKEKANKKTLESYLKKQEPEVVILNGHGDELNIAGHNDEIIMSTSSAHLLKDCNVYMRACSAGKLLGEEVVKQGAKSFIGYKEPFLFFKKNEYIGKPLEDDYARPFFETSNQVALSLINGRNAKEANEDSFKKYKKAIKSLLTSEASNSFLIPNLLWNMRHQVCYES
ncbi:hypothetical protein COB64_00090 [Candidatus Wolfebacteria bacterium]|nr:MAG: hypothetical protein COB64_00090 [Candidatus Wolfebacteria bacterium]